MKRTIYIIIIVIALGGALVMGYLAMTADTGSDGEIIVNPGEAPVYNILPEGKSLEFGTLQNFNKENRFFPYPEVSTTEVGKDLSTIIE